MAKSLYDTLGIGENSTSSEIKKAYRKLAKQYHPDMNKDTNAEDKFKEINAAYEILGDEKKKSQYDMHGDSMFGGQNFHDFAQGQGAGVDINDILSQMFGGGTNRSGFSSGFGGFQNQGFSGGHNPPNLDISSSLTIDFTTAILGGKKTITVENDTFDIKIPEGIKDGQKIRAKGKGRIVQGYTQGDLILTINVSEDNVYTRDDDDLIMNFDITLYKALFGGKVTISTLHKDITLNVPQNTKQNQKFRVKELGALNRKTRQKGFLYLKANIILPKVEDLDGNFIKILKEKLPKE
jgi:curved DNA-binding protein